MGDSEKDVVKRLDVITKLLYMQTKSKIEELKTELIRTEKQHKVYEIIDATKTIRRIATKLAIKVPAL